MQLVNQDIIFSLTAVISIDEHSGNIEHLVNAAEATVASEHTAWLSDALKAQRLMEQTMRNRHEDDDSTPLNASYRKHT